MENEKWSGKMARRPVTSNAARTRRGTDFGRSCDTGALISDLNSSINHKAGKKTHRHSVHRGMSLTRDSSTPSGDLLVLAGIETTFEDPLLKIKVQLGTKNVYRVCEEP
jgi:hypothetical protein